MDDPTLQPVSVQSRRANDERQIGRLIIRITYLAVLLLGVGVASMVATGISPLDDVPALDAVGLIAAIGGLRPEGLLWLGLVAVIATPIIRVLVAASAYARGAEWRMVAISIAILAVIATGVVTTGVLNTLMTES
ncbi:MAG: DUF1634 domain-containing protein [Candidatus Limnocylindrales bacterium]